MVTPASTVFLPHALTVAHRKLRSLLNEGIRQFKRSEQYSNGVEICAAVEGFLGAFSRVPGGDKELQQQAYFTMRKCGDKSDLERARAAAWRAYRKNRQPPSGRNKPWVRLYIMGLRHSNSPPLCLGNESGNGVVGTRWLLERLIEADVLEPQTRTAFLRWLRECKKVEDAAKGLEVDGCAWLLGILPRVSKVAVTQSSGKSATMRAIIRSNDLGGGMLEPMRDAADCLMRWAKGHPSSNKGLAAAPSAAGKVPVKRRKRQSSVDRKLTGKQLEASQIVAECKGNIVEAAQRLGRDPKTVRQHYKVAMEKMGKSVVNHTTKPLPSDRRGQANIADGQDRR